MRLCQAPHGTPPSTQHALRLNQSPPRATHLLLTTELPGLAFLLQLSARQAAAGQRTGRLCAQPRQVQSKSLTATRSQYHSVTRGRTDMAKTEREGVASVWTSDGPLTQLKFMVAEPI